MDKIFIAKQNEVYNIVTSDNENVERKLADYFSFYAPNYKFIPSFKNGFWDGKIRLYDRRTSLLYHGLLTHVLGFCEKFGYEPIFDQDIQNHIEFSYEDALTFATSLNLPDWIEIRDYQIEAFRNAVIKGRQTILSPTSSGKSFIMYLLIRYYQLKTLVIVSTTDLVNQLEEEFKAYGYPNDIHKIYSGQEKYSSDELIISTWQSINKLDPEWFNQFSLVIVDETHRAKAKELRNIIEYTTEVPYKFGLTGSMDGKVCHKWIIEGLFGPVREVTQTHKLIEDKTLSELDINCIVLEYPEQYKKPRWIYQDEIDFICSNNERNDFIVNLVTKIPGNNFVLFRFIEKHGDLLAEKFRKATDRPFYYVHGKSEKELKKNFRELMKNETNAIALVSTDMFGEGTNIPNLNNIFFTHPSKARIKIIQAIGRVLRKTKTKTTAKLYDIADNLYLKKTRNYTMKHFSERIKVYQQEKHPFKILKFRI